MLAAMGSKSGSSGSGNGNNTSSSSDMTNAYRRLHTALSEEKEAVLKLKNAMDAMYELCKDNTNHKQLLKFNGLNSLLNKLSAINCEEKSVSKQATSALDMLFKQPIKSNKIPEKSISSKPSSTVDPTPSNKPKSPVTSAVAAGKSRISTTMLQISGPKQVLSLLVNAVDDDIETSMLVEILRRVRRLLDSIKLDIVVETKAGKTIKSLTKHKDKHVQALAQVIMKRWKDDAAKPPKDRQSDSNSNSKRKLDKTAPEKGDRQSKLTKISDLNNLYAKKKPESVVKPKPQQPAVKQKSAKKSKKKTKRRDSFVVGGGYGYSDDSDGSELLDDSPSAKLSQAEWERQYRAKCAQGYHEHLQEEYLSGLIGRRDDEEAARQEREEAARRKKR